MKIRKIKESDNKQLAHLIREVFEEHDAPRVGTVFSDPTTDDLYELFNNKKSVLWVVEENNEVLGCCGVYPTDGLPEGCAQSLSQFDRAVKMYKKLGFKTLDKPLGNTVHTSCNIWMVKNFWIDSID